ncbi:MAG: ATP-binding protein [Chloroflexota bacterium]|nr:ATP-binding protein [Chloroflexota bacterium]
MSTNLCVLMVEDSENDALLTTLALRRDGYQLDLRRVETPETFQDALQERTWDIVIADYSLPSFTGLAALKLLQASGLDLPFIIVSGTIGEEVAVAAMRGGAHDYVMKDNLARLAPAVQRELREAKVRRERKKSEQALHESEERYRQAVENSPNPIFSVDEQGFICTWNAACVQVFQYPAEQVIEQSYHQLLWESADQAEIDALLVEIWQLDQPIGGYEITYRRKDGRRAVTLSRLYPVRDTEGQVRECVFANTDITKRRQAEDELKRRNRELALLNRSAQVVTSMLDLDGVLIAILNEVRHLLDVVAGSVWLLEQPGGGLICRQAIGTNCELVRGWHLAPDEGIVSWVVSQNKGGIVPDVRKDKHYYPLVDQVTGMKLRSILTVPLRSKGEAIGAVQVVDTKIDSFQPADLRLLESLAATAAIAIENARMYATEQERVLALDQALEQQRELAKLKDQFVQNVSHELRTPLALIRGFSELLESGSLGELQPKQRKPLSVIVSRARMLSKVVEDLTAILAAERQEQQYEPVDMAALIHELSAAFQLPAQQAELKLVTYIPAELPQVLGDGNHLQRVYDNLISNAFKFTPAGGQVTVRLTQEDSELLLEISDTGIGIPADELDRIFDRFYQVDGSMTRRYGGTGLGLSLSKEIVEAHGGRIEVKSVEGKGSTFLVKLPIWEGEDASKTTH